MNKIIIAHRGASAFKKENTIEAFEKALELGAEMIEFDVRKTADNEIIIFHNKKLLGKKINKMLYEDLKKIKGYHIPKLSEALEFLKSKAKIDVHLKEYGYEKEVMDILINYFDESNLIISSQYPESLKKIKADYNIKTILILEVGKIEGLKLFLRKFPEEKIKNSGAEFIAVHEKLAKKRLIEKAKDLEKEVIVWGVNGRKKIEKIFELGASAVISDDLGYGTKRDRLKKLNKLNKVKEVKFLLKLYGFNSL